MRVVFFGSNSFSIPFLDAVKDNVVLVVTTTDKVSGRGNKVIQNPVKEFSKSKAIEVISVRKFDEEVAASIKNSIPDSFVVVSFGKIIPPYILNIVDCSVNVHPSRLPLYRGAAPIERQIMDGVTESAVSIIKVSSELDAGDVIVSTPLKIYFYDTRETVEKRIFEIGIPLLKKTLSLIEKGNYEGIPQEGSSTYAKKITKKDELIDWSKDSLLIYNAIRALSPRPLAYACFRSHILKIASAEPVDEDYEYHAGEICEVEKDFFVVKCGKGALKIIEVIPEGKKRMFVRDFINGYRIIKGEKLEGLK